VKPPGMDSPACLENKTPELSRKRIRECKARGKNPGRQGGLYCLQDAGKVREQER